MVHREIIKSTEYNGTRSANAHAYNGTKAECPGFAASLHFYIPCRRRDATRPLHCTESDFFSGSLGWRSPPAMLLQLSLITPNMDYIIISGTKPINQDVGIHSTRPLGEQLSLLNSLCLPFVFTCT
jgi:hypothetical protein